MRTAFITALILLIILALCVGYIFNIISFIGCDFNVPLKCEILRGIGVFVPPLGGVMGWLDLGL